VFKLFWLLIAAAGRAGFGRVFCCVTHSYELYVLGMEYLETLLDIFSLCFVIVILIPMGLCCAVCSKPFILF
jgi:hypothetical protein